MFSPNKYDIIFWDFDGVIKDSVSVKTDAYVELFSSFGNDICIKIKKHHLLHGGMSRYHKIPLYLNWAGVNQSESEIQRFCDNYSNIVKDKVVGSAWVPGVEEFLKKNKHRYIFILVSATPQSELESICKSLEISDVFYKIYGAPASKSESIKAAMLHHKVKASSCVMIGDSQADIDAAQSNCIHFILRRHNENLHLDTNSDIQIIEGFNEF